MNNEFTLQESKMNSETWPIELSLESVRCFQNLPSALLRPITLLVGENSTGKTTFLGCFAVLHRMFHDGLFFVDSFDFNEEPFNMGSFKDIVRSSQARKSVPKQFVMGLGYSRDSNTKKRVKVIFINKNGQPFLESLIWEVGDASLRIKRIDEQSFSVFVDGEEMEFKGPIDLVFASLRYREFSFANEESGNLPPELVIVYKFFDNWWGEAGSPEQIWNSPFRLRALAPLRASPERTYNPVKETSSPEGNHVPMLLMRLSRSERKSWNSLRSRLIDFGKNSGMFSDISVKNFGQDMSDPFQIQVQVRSNTDANLMDVGYGVSQCLPILVDVFDSINTQFILQQPEVHIHPRAQAELATFFVESVKSSNNRFLIETHSDQIVDRIRINVRKGLVSAEEVSILYFEPKDNAVRVHNLWLDEHGNLEGAPQGYRDFFLHESDLLLGFAD